MPARKNLELVFTPQGHAELREAGNDDEILWSSDDDEDFAEQFDASEFLSEKDTEKVVEYLLDSSTITPAEESELEVYEESFDGEDLTENDDEEESEH